MSWVRSVTHVSEMEQDELAEPESALNTFYAIEFTAIYILVSHRTHK